MELIYTTHRDLLNLHALAPLYSWALLAGATYGLVRLAIDVTRLFLAAPGNIDNLRRRP